jgi:cytochrome P450
VVVRRVAAPVTIGGVALAPGGFVMASMYLLHRRGDLFPEPDAFLPERFLGRQPKPGTYLPFGAGLRRCLGSALATRQMRTVLAEVLREFDVKSERPATLREARRNVTVVPGEPLLVTLRRER